jgi:hypothetical protein
VSFETTTGKIEKYMEDSGIGNFFLNRIQIIQEIGTRVEKWIYNELKSFYPSKEKNANI